MAQTAEQKAARAEKMAASKAAKATEQAAEALQAETAALAEAANAAKVVYLTLEGAKAYTPRTDCTIDGWGELVVAIEAKVPYRVLRSKDTPITLNNDNRGFAAYTVRRGWTKKCRYEADGTMVPIG